MGAGLATGNGLPAELGTARHWLQLGPEAGDVLRQRNLATLILNKDAAMAA